MDKDNGELHRKVSEQIRKMPESEMLRKLRESDIIPFLGGRPEVINDLTGKSIKRNNIIDSEDLVNMKVAIGEIEVNHKRVGEMVKEVIMTEDVAWDIFFKNI